jgi:hypothetical protein
MQWLFARIARQRREEHTKTKWEPGLLLGSLVIYRATASRLVVVFGDPIAIIILKLCSSRYGSVQTGAWRDDQVHWPVLVAPSQGLLPEDAARRNPGGVTRREAGEAA